MYIPKLAPAITKESPTVPIAPKTDYIDSLICSTLLEILFTTISCKNSDPLTVM